MSEMEAELRDDWPSPLAQGMYQEGIPCVGTNSDLVARRPALVQFAYFHQPGTSAYAMVAQVTHLRDGLIEVEIKAQNCSCQEDNEH